jgi:hypothetical protein
MAVFRLCFGVYVVAILMKAVSRPVMRNKEGSLMGGTQVLATFTMWSWSLIGVYGFVTGTVSAFEAAGFKMSGKSADVLSLAAWVAFEVLTSVSILVCLVVWLVLVPLMPALATHIVPLSAHNLNVVFMLAEMYLNRLPFVHSHYLFALYYGIVYIVFTWLYCLSTGIVFYFFIDWRKWIVVPGYTVLIGLLYASFAGSRLVCNRIKESPDEDPSGYVEVSVAK